MHAWFLADKNLVSNKSQVDLSKLIFVQHITYVHIVLNIRYADTVTCSLYTETLECAKAIQHANVVCDELTTFGIEVLDLLYKISQT